jgi:hypothetical protein
MCRDRDRQQKLARVVRSIFIVQEVEMGRGLKQEERMR